jgi:tripartite-type tricarboxylate transporter receptor subunit TctC
MSGSAPSTRCPRERISARSLRIFVARLQREVARAITSPAIREKLATQLMEPIPSTPAEFRARIDADLARWTPVIKAANIRIN